MNDTPLPSWESMLLCAVSSTPVSTHAGPAELRVGGKGCEPRRRGKAAEDYSQVVRAEGPVAGGVARLARQGAAGRGGGAALGLRRADAGARNLAGGLHGGVGIEVAGSKRCVGEDGRRWSEELRKPAAMRPFTETAIVPPRLALGGLHRRRTAWWVR